MTERVNVSDKKVNVSEFPSLYIKTRVTLCGVTILKSGVVLGFVDDF